MSDDAKKALIGHQFPVLDKGFVELQDVMGDDLAIVNAARVSFLGESKGLEKDKKLLFYLMQHRHTSPFEMVEFKMRVKAPLVTWWQWARHRTWCLSGDTEIIFNRPDRWRKGMHTKQTGNKGAKFTAERLYQLWHGNSHHRKQISNMLIRVYDEDAKVFTVSHITDVIYSGKKQVFEIELEDGKLLKCSKDHLILTNEGWQRLEDAIGLSVSGSGTATMTKECFVLTNGTEDLWRSYEWMKAQRDAGLSVQEIADKAGCSYHNIRKWLKIHNLQFDQTQYLFNEGFTPWNKGKKGYSQPPRTEEHLAKLRAKVKKGPESHFWRGGVSTDRELIGAWTTGQARKVHERFNFTCQICGQKTDKLQAHHIKPVVDYPELAYDFDNLMTVCQDCHIKIHTGKEMSRSHNGTPLAALHKKVVKVRLVGIIDTYDIAVEGPNHNFVANGVVVHNSFNAQSGRYTPFEENDYYFPSVWRKQAESNKQASEGEIDSAEGEKLTALLTEHYEHSFALYQQALDAGVAKELARLFLPGFSVYYTWVVKVDAHNLMHWIELRMAPDAQEEIRKYAEVIYNEIFKQVLPWTAEAFEKFRLSQRRNV